MGKGKNRKTSKKEKERKQGKYLNMIINEIIKRKKKIRETINRIKESTRK